MTIASMQLIFNQRTHLPLILQDERADCGHACIAMISHFWGHRLDLFDLRSMSASSNRGITLLEINKLLENLGFMTRALRVPLEELSLIKCPAILHWDMNHFVVLKKVKKNHVIIHDPAMGVRRCSLAEVSQSFTGIVLEIEKSNDFKEIRANHKLTIFDLIKTMNGIQRYVVLLILLSLSIEILSLMNPLFLQYVTDDVIGLSEKSNLYIIAMGFIILTMIHAFIDYIRGNMVIYLTNNLTEQFSSNVVKHILKLPLVFFEKRHKGDVQSKFQSIDEIQKKMSTDFINTVLDGFMILINVAVMLVYSGFLTILVIFVLFIGLAIRYTSYHFLRKQTESSIYQHAKASSVFLETLHGIIPIKSFLKEGIRFNCWRNEYIQSLNADIKIARVNVIYHLIEQVMSHMEHILVVCVGATLVLANRFSVGMLIAFLSYRLLFIAKASSFMQHMFDYKLISIQLGRLGDILFQQPEVISQGSGRLDRVQGALTLKNISFKYHEHDKEVLHHINLSIKAGEKVAIIGPSGCGKSTLLKVMMGLLESTEGDIFLDDISIKDFGLKNYRELTAAVMQEDSLLSGSILDNIAFFDENIDVEHVYHSAKLACIHDTICQLPMAYETLIGDMGSNLSGGQKQRILLARALYKKPKLLFLDEATSHLDVENERNINLALKSLNMTQIIIAHRQETIQMADRVILLPSLAPKF